jgi:hypothetical protein
MSCNTSTVLPIRFVCRASRDHKPLGIVCNHLACSAYLIRIVNIRASLVITCLSVKNFFLFCVDVEKTEYMLLSRHQNVGQNRDIKIANRSFENVSPFKYLGTTVTNQNLIQEEIKRRLNSGNACYHSVQNLLSSRLLSKNFKIRIYKTIILSVVLYGCETWPLTLREEHKLRVFGNRVLRRTEEG